MERLLIRDVLLFDGTGVDPRPHSAILIEGDAIAWIGPDADVDSVPAAAGCARLEANGQVVLPGLIDSHVHLCSEPARPAGYDPMGVSSNELTLRVVDHAQDALRAGITTVADCGGRGLVTLEVRDAIAAGLVSGPRVLTAGQGITITNGHFHDYSIEADGVTEVRKAARRLVGQGVDFIKFFGTGGGTMNSNPGLAQYSMAEFRAVVEEAERGGIRVTSHVHGTLGIRNAVEAGIHRLEHVHFFNRDGAIEFDPELADQIARSNTPISLGMPQQWRADSSIEAFLTPRQREHRALRFQRVEVIGQLLDHGIDVVASTDAGMTMTPFGDLPQLLMWLVREVGMSVGAVIHSATGRAAAALGIANMVGTLAPGMAADLVLLAADPRRDPTELGRPCHVIKAGRPVVASGNLLDLR